MAQRELDGLERQTVPPRLPLDGPLAALAALAKPPHEWVKNACFGERGRADGAVPRSELPERAGVVTRGEPAPMLAERRVSGADASPARPKRAEREERRASRERGAEGRRAERRGDERRGERGARKAR